MGPGQASVAVHGKRKVVSLPGTQRKKMVFALTPLADAMFQLLIFFMLSSSLAPYSLMTLTPGLSSVAAAAAPSTDTPSKPSIWNLSNGTIRVGVVELPISQTDAFIKDMQAKGSDQVVIFSDGSASVQDVATVLNRLTLSGVGSVELIAAEGR